MLYFNISMKKQDVLNCIFSSWYPSFKQHTIKSLIIPLQEKFVSYLKENGTLMLPRGLYTKLTAGEPASSDEEEEESWEDEKQEEELDEQPEFSDLILQISSSINNLGGNVFPKMGWSSPKDAAWINCNSLNCSSADEILLLLKSSDFISYDLTSPFKLCVDASSSDDIPHELVLRKWANLVPGMEFRCFIRARKLIGISQRDHRQYYDYIVKDKEALAEEMCKFIESAILHTFPSDDFVVDLYKKRDGSYWILDFNPFGEMTDSLLFTWAELQGELSEYDASIYFQDTGQFRYASANSTLQPSEHLSYGMPVDFIDLSTGADATKLVDFLRMRMQNGEESSDESEDEQWRLPETS